MQRARAIRPWHVSVVLLAVYALGAVVLYRTPWALVTPGHIVAGIVPPGVLYSDEGYDGQFTYALARTPLDPAAAAPTLDAPAYRAQRMLLPLLGWLAALGQPRALPWALLAVNAIALAGGVAALEALLHQYGAGRWAALGLGASAGMLGAARLSLPEPLAYGLCVLALLAWLRGRVLLAGALFGAAALAKETTLVVAAGVGLSLLVARDLPRAAGFAVLALGPFALWQAFLRATLGAFGVGSGGAGASGFTLVPFGGVWEIYAAGGPRVFGALMLILGPFVLLPTLWALWRAGRDVLARRWHPLTGPLLTSALIMVFVPFSTTREPLGILRFVVGLHLVLVVYAAAKRERRALRFSTLWALGVLLVVASDVWRAPTVG